MTELPAPLAERLDALREEHCYITSVDGCCHCGDCECDGIGCIAGIDPDDGEDYDALENLHTLLREGQAWRVMQAILQAGEQPIVALMLTHEALAYANNQMVTEDCAECGRVFGAQGPCDDRCTACRLGVDPLADALAERDAALSCLRDIREHKTWAYTAEGTGKDFPARCSFALSEIDGLAAAILGRNDE